MGTSDRRDGGGGSMSRRSRESQSDIKKLRRENEQLRREIWSLRDEYDKLEEILKQQKNRDESDAPEDCSEDEAAGLDNSDYDEEEDDEEEDDEDDDDSGSEEEANIDHDQSERLENAENQKISSENINNISSVQHRSRINFDGLPVVTEEEELKKDKDRKDNNTSNDKILQNDAIQKLPCTPQNNFTFHPTSFNQINPLTTSSFSYQTDCPFSFPAGETASSYPNILPMDRNCLPTTNSPQICSGNDSQQSVTSPHLATPSLNSTFDISTDNRSHLSLLATPPPPAGWQNSVTLLSTGGSPISTSNFPLVTGTQSPVRHPRFVATNDLPLKVPEGTKILENGQPIASISYSTLTGTPNLAERRKAFFKQDTNNSSASRILDNGLQDFTTQNIEKNKLEEQNGLAKRVDNGTTMAKEGITSDALLWMEKNRPRHFFAPLNTKLRLPCNGDSEIESINDNTVIKNGDSGNSPSSEKTVSTVISRSRYNCEKGSADICVNGVVAYNGETQIERGDAKAFFSSENLLMIDDTHNHESSNGSTNLLTKSVSCQDLTSRLSFTENLKSNSNDQHAKSDNTLDNMSTISKAYKSQIEVVLKPSQFHKSLSPDTPEIPKLPSIDYKLFSNPFLQNFEQAYQNFPVRTEGPSPVTHPLSIQVCESPVSGTSYSTPVKIQPSFSGPSMTESDYKTYKRKDLERLRLMIPSAKVSDTNGDCQEYHVTSFETPSPHTLQIPPMTPYELETFRRMPTISSPHPQNSRLYQNVPFEPRGAAVYCPGQGMRMYYDTASMKVPAQTQTSPENELTQPENVINTPTEILDSKQQTLVPTKKRGSRKEKSGSMKSKQKSPGSQRRKEQLKKQNSVTSKDNPESPGKFSSRLGVRESQDDKNESRSSSSGQESPKKDQTKRVSLYLSTKKRPSLSSVRTSRSRSVENARERHLGRDEAFEGNATNSERERTNSISSRDAAVREKTRKGSTSSGSVPWCACWGNGCV